VTRALLASCVALAMACAAVRPADAPERYRLAESGEQWHVSGDDRVLEDVRVRYPEFMRKVLDPREHGELDIRPVRQDLEHVPVDRRNFDALNAVAISYFELNHRAEAEPGGPGYFDNSFQAAKLLALPWKAYGLVPDPELRDAILDFFEDAGSGEKLDSASTAPRLAGIVASLEAKETDDGRIARIRDLTHQLGGATGLRPGD
jgi:hypothetical protein